MMARLARAEAPRRRAVIEPPRGAVRCAEKLSSDEPAVAEFIELVAAILVDDHLRREREHQRGGAP